MRDQQQNFRKAAILVASLDARRRDALLSQLPVEQADALRQAAATLGPLGAHEQTSVIEEFFRIGPMVPQKEPSGIELSGTLSEHVPRTSVRDEYVPHAEQQRKPFEFLEDAHVESIAPLLEREHPQTIAVIVSHLAPQRAADVLASLPGKLQADIARRLVDLERLDPDVLRDLELETQRWMGHQLKSRQGRAAGLATLSNILGAADVETQRRLMANLAQHDRQLARHIAPRSHAILCFDDLVHLDDCAWRRLLHKALPETVVIALAGARPQLVERVLRQLPDSEAKRLRRALADLHATEAVEVESAQQELLQLAQQLGRGKRPAKPKYGGLSLAA